MFSNPIEKIVVYLHEVGDPLLTIAATVERNADALRQAELKSSVAGASSRKVVDCSWPASNITMLSRKLRRPT
jgi:hypothetical protein